MKYQFEETGHLEASLQLTIEPADYKAEFNTELKKLRKNADMKGFRKGMVPLGLIKKMAGKDVLSKLIAEKVDGGVNQYFDENKVAIILRPMDLTNPDSIVIDHKTDKEYTFTFGVGTVGDIDIEDVLNTPIHRYKIDFTDDDLEEELLRLRKSNGTTNEHADFPLEEEDVIKFHLVEANEDGTVKDDGLEIECEMSLIYDFNTAHPDFEKVKALSSKEEQLSINPFELLITEDEERTDENVANRYLLANEKDENADEEGENENDVIENLSRTWLVNVGNISRKNPAELNEEFYMQVLQELDEEEELTDLESFKGILKSRISTYFAREASKLADEVIKDTLFEKGKASFSEDFVKKYYTDMISADIPEALMQNAIESVNHSAVINALAKQKEITLEESDIIDAIYKKLLDENPYLSYLGAQANQYIDEMMRKKIEDENEVKEAQTTATITKVVHALRDDVTYNDEEISKEGFEEVLNKKRTEEMQRRMEEMQKENAQYAEQQQTGEEEEGNDDLVDFPEAEIAEETATEVTEQTTEDTDK